MFSEDLPWYRLSFAAICSGSVLLVLYCGGLIVECGINHAEVWCSCFGIASGRVGMNHLLYGVEIGLWVGPVGWFGMG